jgi:hypothetical protein
MELRIPFYGINRLVSRAIRCEPSTRHHCFRHLSPSIAPKRHFLTVYMTVKFVSSGTKSFSFRCLQLPETIEWE